MCLQGARAAKVTCGAKISTFSAGIHLLWGQIQGSGSVVKNRLPMQVTRSIPESGRPSEEGNGNPFQYSRLGNPTDRRAWRAIVPGIEKESDMTYGLNSHSILKVEK